MKCKVGIYNNITNYNYDNSVYHNLHYYQRLILYIHIPFRRLENAQLPTD